MFNFLKKDRTISVDNLELEGTRGAPDEMGLFAEVLSTLQSVGISIRDLMVLEGGMEEADVLQTGGEQAHEKWLRERGRIK